MKLGNIVMLIGVIAGCSACTEVLPRQRGSLALPQMALTTDAMEFGLRQHIAFSKEAASGGYGGGGGGCGCN
ncbi:MAG: DUF4266 domain-containing protein [Methylococcaceae bacterium]